MEYIEREAICYQLAKQATIDGQPRAIKRAAKIVADFPAADVRPVVLCGVCELHGHCYTEDVFVFARLAEENRFCAVGKVKTNSKGRRKADV